MIIKANTSTSSGRAVTYSVSSPLCLLPLKTQLSAGLMWMTGLVASLTLTSLMSTSVALTSLAFTPTAFAAPPVTNFEYDANGNLTKVTDGLNHATVNTYDKLNRRITSTNANTGLSQYAYNALDQMTQVTDPKTLVTSYSYDGLSNLNQQISPDTGTTANTYDASGNVLTKADAKGQVTTYSYDSLNRVTLIVYHDNSTITYGYDQGTNGLGRLTSITDSNSSIGTISYTYNTRGRILTETRTMNSIGYVTGYTYNSAGQLTGVTYPSGRTLTYTLDSLGRLNQVSTTQSGVTQVLASNIQYRPFGPAQSLQFGNNTPYVRQFDSDGRITSYTLGSQTINLNYDAASRISSTTETQTSANVKNYGYDVLDRLTSYTDLNSSQGYGYDANGNRTSLTVGASNYAYTYPGTSNRLSSTQGPAPAKTYAYDANGSPTTDNINQYAYDTRGRLTQAVTASGTYNYGINALGQRIHKIKSATGTLYHYDLQGHLIAETDTAGVVKQEYAYLYEMPLAVLK